MSGMSVLRRAGLGGGRGDVGVAPVRVARRPQGPGAAAGIGLWVFIGVASTLFALFMTAYVMRMSEPDWSPIALPWQLALSSLLLAAGSVAMQAAASRAAGGRPAGVWWHAGGALALAFLAVQLWGWQALLTAQVTLAGNPAASFFYLLTAMHGLHVAGGLVGWVWAGRADAAAWRIALCARYWHFLLLVWLLVYGTIAGLTPEMARVLCGKA